jgi:acyl carrier protein
MHENEIGAESADSAESVESVESVEMVTRLVCRLRKVDVSQVPPDADLVNTLGFDSLDAAELVAAIHQETGRELNAESMDDLRSVESIARTLVGGEAR